MTLLINLTGALTKMKIFINSLGILLATLGSFLVWKFIKDISFADKEAYLNGKGLLIVPKVDDADVKKYKKSVFFSNLGLVLILCGGILQIISNYL